jgi:hypothetical protein
MYSHHIGDRADSNSMVIKTCDTLLTRYVFRACPFKLRFVFSIEAIKSIVLVSDSFFPS